MKFLGVAGIWDDHRRTSGSTSNGNWILEPDGSIEQWGTVTLVAGLATITFPLAFPTGCNSVALTPINSAAATTVCDTRLTAAPSKTSALVTGSLISTGTPSAGTFSVMWRAWGN